MRNTPINLIPVPNLDDAPNVPLHLGDVADQLETFTIARFANAAQRDLRWPNPPNGAVCVTIDNFVSWQARGGVWVSAAMPRVLPLVHTPVEVNAFTLPTDPITRLYLVAWSWWTWNHQANATMQVSLRLQGGGNVGLYNIDMKASAPPVPTLSSVSYFQVTKLAGTPAQIYEAVLTRNPIATGWSADGYVNTIGYPA
jgi:hypothetical protein